MIQHIMGSIILQFADLLSENSDFSLHTKCFEQKKKQTNQCSSINSITAIHTLTCTEFCKILYDIDLQYPVSCSCV